MITSCFGEGYETFSDTEGVLMLAAFLPTMCLMLSLVINSLYHKITVSVFGWGMSLFTIVRVTGAFMLFDAECMLECYLNRLSWCLFFTGTNLTTSCASTTITLQPPPPPSLHLKLY